MSLTVSHNGEKRVFPNHMLESICIELAGGGLTQKQVIVAMMLADNLRNRGIAKFMGGKVVITLTAEPTAEDKAAFKEDDRLLIEDAIKGSPTEQKVQDILRRIQKESKGEQA